MPAANWPKHPDGRSKKIGEMSPTEQRAIGDSAGRRLQVELDDPKSEFRRGVDAILTGPVIPRTKQ